MIILNWKSQTRTHEKENLKEKNLKSKETSKISIKVEYIDVSGT